MAKKERANLNKVIVESFSTIARSAKISTANITEQDLETLGIIDSTGSVSYDRREIRMLIEATQNMFSYKDASPLFDLLRIKNPEYSEEVIANDFFQTKFAEITGQGKTILGYDHRVKALEQRFKPHVSTGKLRVMLDGQEVAPLDYMQLLASAARTEKMYTGTAQLRESFKTTQDELIVGLFREPNKSQEIRFEEERQQALERIGVKIERLRTTINGGYTEDSYPIVADNIKYNMRYFDESLTDEGIERVAHAARATHSTIAAPFFESALGIHVDPKNTQRYAPVDVRAIAPKDRDLIASFLALKPKEKFSDVRDRIYSYAETVGTAIDGAVEIINMPKNQELVDAGLVKIGHELAYKSVRDTMGSDFGNLNEILRKDLTKRIIDSSAIATSSRAEFLRNTLYESMNQEFIESHFGDYYLGETIIYHPVVDQEGKPAVDDHENRIPPKVEHTGEYQVMVFGDDNVYPITLSTVKPTKERIGQLVDENGNLTEHVLFIPRAKGEDLGSFSDEELEYISNYINENIDTKANLRSLSSRDIKFGAANPLSKIIYDAYQEAHVAELAGKEEKNKNPYSSDKASKPALYRDLPLYKQYLSEAKQRLEKYVVINGAPALEGQPYQQERVIEEPVDTKTDYQNWKIIESIRKNYSDSLGRLINARSEIKAEVPEGMDEEAFKQSEEYRQAILGSKAYRQADQNWVSFNENRSVKATEYLMEIFKNRDAELQPEEGEPIQTEYGIMANMFESILKTKRLNEIQKGLKDGTYEPKEGEDVYTSVEEVTAAKESEILARYDLNTRLLELGKVDEMTSALYSDKQPTADPTHTA